jgi:hypothetical protein
MGKCYFYVLFLKWTTFQDKFPILGQSKDSARYPKLNQRLGLGLPHLINVNCPKYVYYEHHGF